MSLAVTILPVDLGPWFSLVPSILVAVAVLMVPGLVVVAATTRLRPWTVALAPAVSVGVISVSTVAFGSLGVRWSLPMLAASTLVVAAAAFGMRRLVKADGGEPYAPANVWWWLGGGALVGGLFITVRVVRALNVPSAVSQTFDAVFHLNAVQHIIQSGDGSALGLRDFTGNAFYPLGWHNVVAHVAQAAGVGVPEAVTATNIAIAGLVWPLGAAALVAVMLPHRAWLAGAAGVLAAGFGAFPYFLLRFGLLYANFLSFALLAACLAGAVSLLRLPRSAAPVGRGEKTVRVLLLLVAGAGVALAQPNGLLALLLMVAPLALWSATAVAIEGWKTRARVGLWTVAAAVAYVGALAVIWQLARPPREAAGWPRFHFPAQAIGISLTGSAWPGILAWAIVVPMVAGFIVLVRKPALLWTYAPLAMATVLFTAASGLLVESELRMFLAGPFVADSQRISALLPVGSVVIATLGVESIVNGWQLLAGRMLEGWEPRKARRLVAAGTAVLGAALLHGVGLDNANVNEAVAAMGQYHRAGALLTDDERAVLERLPAYTADDALIAGNPSTGAALAFALGGRPVTEPHIFNEASDDIRFVAANLDDVDSDPQVCAAILRAGIDYVLDFGSRSVLPWDATGIDYSGFNNVRAGNHLELVTYQGRAELFRVNCEQ